MIHACEDAFPAITFYSIFILRIFVLALAFSCIDRSAQRGDRKQDEGEGAGHAAAVGTKPPYVGCRLYQLSTCFTSKVQASRTVSEALCASIPFPTIPRSHLLM